MNTKRRTQVLLLIILLIAAISGGYYYQSLQDKTFALYGNVDGVPLTSASVSVVNSPL